MSHRVFPRARVLAFLIPAVLAVLTVSSQGAPKPGQLWIPHDPPGADYVLQAAVTVSAGTASIQGRGSITLVNTTSEPLSVLAMDWTDRPERPFELSVGGKPVRFLNASKGLPPATPLMFELPSPLAPGGKVRLDVVFSFAANIQDGRAQSQAWYPALWWDGIPVRSAFKVRIDVPQGFVVMASGRLDPKTGLYENDCVTTRFGIVLSNTLHADEVESDGVLIRALSTDGGRACARVCLEAAADIVKFYKAWLGRYPHRSLCVIPGGPKPWGGYPFASGIVVIHGEETYDAAKGEKEKAWWKWITAHEIGHQYWGEFLMSDDVRTPYTDSWLMIGMGIAADKQYLLGRGMGWTRYRGFIDGYLEGVKAGYDTTMDAPPSLAKTQKFDTNNVVIHGKGFAVASALETVLGPELFDKIYRGVVASHAGKRLGWREFRRLCEEACGQDLGWFFEDWVRSNRYLDCRVTSRSSVPGGAGFVNEIGVEFGLDSIRMPVPVKAVFEDGTSRVEWTDRFVRTNVFKFESRSKMADAVLDPDGRLAVVKEPPPKTAADLAEAIENLDWTGTSEAALAIVKRPEAKEIRDAHAWFKLGLLLYDGGRNAESFEAFKRCGELDASDQNLFGALVWMGITKDAQGDRAAAVPFFTEALKHDTGQTLQHDQYGLRINKAWVEERLKTPFKRTP